MDHRELERIRQIRNRDNVFAVNMGVYTTEITEDHAKGEMEVKDSSRNLNGSVHGGCLYTMADSIGGSAASAQGYRIATASGHIEYLAPALKTEKLFAEAEVVKSGKRIIVCEVRIYDDDRKILMIGLFEYTRLKEKY